MASALGAKPKGNEWTPGHHCRRANVSPVVIETDVFPAVTVEPEAVSRLRAQLRTTGRKILSSIAVRLPGKTAAEVSQHTLQKDLVSAVDLEMALYTGSNPSAASR